MEAYVILVSSNDIGHFYYLKSQNAKDNRARVII